MFAMSLLKQRFQLFSDFEKPNKKQKGQEDDLVLFSLIASYKKCLRK